MRRLTLNDAFGLPVMVVSSGYMVHALQSAPLAQQASLGGLIGLMVGLGLVGLWHQPRMPNPDTLTRITHWSIVVLACFSLTVLAAKLAWIYAG